VLDSPALEDPAKRLKNIDVLRRVVARFELNVKMSVVVLKFSGTTVI
jgi:hypothetical protein